MKMIKGPKYHLYKEKLRELEMEKKEPKEKGQKGCLCVKEPRGKWKKDSISSMVSNQQKKNSN